MACFLGILHHQRPGFLSYPSSHLVPYLRDKKYPESQYPEMYEYRSLRPRLLAKIKRAFGRISSLPKKDAWEFQKSAIEKLDFPAAFDCLITSPPYMNALDYNRDNRLRLWFINPQTSIATEGNVKDQRNNFISAISTMFEKVEVHLKGRKYCIVIVGEKVSRNRSVSLSRNICEIAKVKAPSLTLVEVIKDDIPDIRRCRRNCSGTKSEHVLVFQKEQLAK